MISRQGIMGFARAACPTMMSDAMAHYTQFIMHWVDAQRVCLTVCLGRGDRKEAKECKLLPRLKRAKVLRSVQSKLSFLP